MHTESGSERIAQAVWLRAAAWAELNDWCGQSQCQTCLNGRRWRAIPASVSDMAERLSGVTTIHPRFAHPPLTHQGLPGLQRQPTAATLSAVEWRSASWHHNRRAYFVLPLGYRLATAWEVTAYAVAFCLAHGYYPYHGEGICNEIISPEFWQPLQRLHQPRRQCTALLTARVDATSGILFGDQPIAVEPHSGTVAYELWCSRFDYELGMWLVKDQSGVPHGEPSGEPLECYLAEIAGLRRAIWQGASSKRAARVWRLIDIQNRLLPALIGKTSGGISPSGLA